MHKKINFSIVFLAKTLYNKFYKQKFFTYNGEDMDMDIKFFINSIREKTGIECSVYTKNGEFIAGEEIGTINIPADFDGVYADQTNNCTIFSVVYKGKTLIARIDGCSKAEKNYAQLLKELAENFFFKETSLSQTDLFKAILLGEMNKTQIIKYMHKFSIKDASAFVMLIEVDASHLEETKNILAGCAETLDIVLELDKQIAFIKFIEDESAEYQPPSEYAEFIKQLVYEEVGANVKIAIGGTVKSVLDLGISFSQAVSAFRMSKMFGSRGEIHTFKEFMLIKMLEDLPKHKLSENLQTLMDLSAKEIFSDEEMLSTAEEFLESSLNTSETSRKLYLHRNTLIYRLDKIEKATGLNIRKFSDAITFRLITILSNLVK